MWFTPLLTTPLSMVLEAWAVRALTFYFAKFLLLLGKPPALPCIKFDAEFKFCIKNNVIIQFNMIPVENPALVGLSSDSVSKVLPNMKCHRPASGPCAHNLHTPVLMVLSDCREEK